MSVLSVGAALYLKLYGPPISLVCKFPERPQRPVSQRNRGRRNFCQGNTQAWPTLLGCKNGIPEEMPSLEAPMDMDPYCRPLEVDF